jgi:hypothetical protein
VQAVVLDPAPELDEPPEPEVVIRGERNAAGLFGILQIPRGLAGREDSVGVEDDVLDAELLDVAEPFVRRFRDLAEPETHREVVLLGRSGVG